MPKKKVSKSDIDQATDERDQAAALEAVKLSSGGKLLIKGFLTDIVGDVETLAAQYRNFTLQEFISICAHIEVQLDTLRALTRSTKNKKYTEEELKKILEEAEDQEED